MIHLHQVLQFAVVSAVLIVIPGPSAFFVVGRAIAFGQRIALATVAGNAMGLTAVTVVFAVGVGALVTDTPTLQSALRLSGAAYIIWLGAQAMRRGASWGDDAARSGSAASCWWRAAAQGFVVGLTNPKSLVIVATIVPSFVDPERGSETAQMLELGSIAVLFGVACDSLWAVTAGRSAAWFARSSGRVKLLSSVGGSAMIGVGVLLSVEGLTGA